MQYVHCTVAVCYLIGRAAKNVEYLRWYMAAIKNLKSDSQGFEFHFLLLTGIAGKVHILNKSFPFDC